MIVAGDPDGHSYICSAQDEDFISIEDGVALLIEDDEFVTVFLSDFFTELANSRFHAFFLPAYLAGPSRFERPRERHHQNGEVDVGSEGVNIVLAAVV